MTNIPLVLLYTNIYVCLLFISNEALLFAQNFQLNSYACCVHGHYSKYTAEHTPLHHKQNVADGADLIYFSFLFFHCSLLFSFSLRFHT